MRDIKIKEINRRIHTSTNLKANSVRKMSHSCSLNRGSNQFDFLKPIDSVNLNKHSESCVLIREIDFSFFEYLNLIGNDIDATCIIQKTSNSSEVKSKENDKTDRSVHQANKIIKNSIIPEMTDFSSDCKVQTPRELSKPTKSVTTLKINSSNEMEKHKMPIFLKKQIGAVSLKKVEENQRNLNFTSYSAHKNERKLLTPKIIYNSKSMHSSLIQNSHKSCTNDTYQSDSDYCKTEIINSINHSPDMSRRANQNININVNVNIGNISTKYINKPSSGSNGYVKAGTFDCIKDISNQVHSYLAIEKNTGNQYYLSRNYDPANLYPEPPYYGIGTSSDIYYQVSEVQTKVIEFPDSIITSEENSSKNPVCCGEYNTQKVCLTF